LKRQDLHVFEINRFRRGRRDRALSTAGWIDNRFFDRCTDIVIRKEIQRKVTQTYPAVLYEDGLSDMTMIATRKSTVTTALVPSWKKKH
jgi:hypothetical protein